MYFPPETSIYMFLKSYRTRRLLCEFNQSDVMSLTRSGCWQAMARPFFVWGVPGLQVFLYQQLSTLRSHLADKQLQDPVPRTGVQSKPLLSVNHLRGWRRHSCACCLFCIALKAWPGDAPLAHQTSAHPQPPFKHNHSRLPGCERVALQYTVTCICLKHRFPQTQVPVFDVLTLA